MQSYDRNEPGRFKGRVAKFTFCIIVHEYRRGGACPSRQYNATIIKQYKAMYGEIVAFYEIAVHLFIV